MIKMWEVNLQATGRLYLSKEAEIQPDEIYLFQLCWFGFFTRTKAFCLSKFSGVLGTAMQNYVVNICTELLELFHGHITSYISNSPSRSSRSSIFIVFCH